MIPRPVFIFWIVTSLCKVTSQDMCDNRAMLSRLNALENEVTSIRNQMKIGETLFMATLSTPSISIKHEEPIKWDEAPINLGGHFNTTTGSYIVPYHGYYQFSITKRSNDQRAHFHLRVNGQRHMYTELYTSGSDAPSGSATIALELHAGQVIQVSTYRSNIIFGTQPNGIMYSWFTGFMLYRL